MNNRIKIKALVTLGILFPVCLSAQQTIADYNLLDNGGTWSTNSNSATPPALMNDKNEATCFVEDNFTGDTWFTYQSPVPVVVKAYTIVPSGEADCNPSRFRLYGSNDGDTWKMISSVVGPTYPGNGEPALNLLSAGDAYQYIKLAVTNIKSGSTLKIAEYQLLGYASPAWQGIVDNATGTLTGEYNGNSSEPLANIANDDTGSKFKQNGANSCWMQYELDTPQRVTGYSITSTTANAWQNSLRSWELMGSNDGENWETLDVRSNKNLFEINNNSQVYEFTKDDKKHDWAHYADLTHASMYELFWKPYGSGHYLTHSWHPNNALVNKGFNYWWMAHALDVMIDAYARTGDIAYRDKMNSIYTGMLQKGKNEYGRNDLWNGYFDDMEWMALACQRANTVYSSTPRWKEAALQLWNWIKVGWNDHHGGGIQWVDSKPTSKNACSNAPAIILVARLYQETGDEQYLEWALKIFNWMNDNLLFEDNGLVKDGYGNNEMSWTLTYNQGTWIGACLELYQITNEQKYYDIAMKTADYVVNDRSKFSPHGVLYNNEGGGDGGLFKGIFMRYLSQWILSGKLDTRRQALFVEYLFENGKSLWECATLKPEMIVKNTWLERPERLDPTAEKGSGYDASIHLSAVMLFELLAELERNGYAPKNRNTALIANTEKEYKYFRLAATSRGSNIELGRWQLYTSSLTGMEETTLADSFVRIEALKNGLAIHTDREGCFPLTICNVNGQLVRRENIEGGYRHIGNLSAGMYLVSVSEGGRTFSQKLVITQP